MKYSTQELYGNIPKELIDKRKEVLKEFREYAQANLRELLKNKPIVEVDDKLFNAILHAMDWCKGIIEEEIK